MSKNIDIGLLTEVSSYQMCRGRKLFHMLHPFYTIITEGTMENMMHTIENNIDTLLQQVSCHACFSCNAEKTQWIRYINESYPHINDTYPQQL